MLPRLSPRRTLARAATAALVFCASSAAALGAASWVAPAPAHADVIDRIVAKINDDIVTLHDLKRRSGPYLIQRQIDPGTLEERSDMRDVLRSVLQDMINTRLLLQEANKSQITVDDNEVARVINNQARAQRMTEDQFRQALDSNGIAWLTYRSFMRDYLITRRVIQIKLGSKVKITDDEVRRAYRQEFGEAPRVKTVELSHISLDVPSDADEARRVRALARTIYTKLSQGGDFAELAKQHSQGPTADTGGALGTFRSGSMGPTLEGPIFSTPEGRFTEPIEHADRIQIFRVDSATVATDAAAQQRMDKLREGLFYRELNKKLQVWLDNLRKAAYVRVLY